MHRYCVRSIRDLSNVIIPFFKENKLKTHKLKDFDLFCEVMNLIEHKEHLNLEGLKKIANIAMQMNRKVKPKFLESSHTIRRTSSET
jgi:hypothetical protein